MAQNMAYRLVGDVLVVVHNDRFVSDATWNAYLDVALAAAQDAKTMPFGRQFVITAGGRPTLRQQFRAHHAIRSRLPGGMRLPVAAVSESLMLRVALAINRRRINVRTFYPHEVVQALAWLDIDPLRAQAIARALPELGRAVGGSPTCGIVQRALERLVASDAFTSRLERERAKIAGELESGLGAELRQVRHGLEELRSRADAAQESDVAMLLERIVEAENELRGIVWALQADDRSWGDVSHYVQDCLKQLFDARCHADISGPRDAQVPSPVALHALRIAQEGLRNALDHACADHIALQLACDGHAIRVRIDDDGRGIPVDRRQRSYGGVHHIRTRAALAGGVAKLQTGDTGTEWVVELPLSH